jgi:hypothetical protein
MTQEDGCRSMTNKIPNCDCIKQIKIEISKKFDTEVVTVHHTHFECWYKKYTKKGELSKHWTNCVQHFKYCPFCGTKYETQ